jgi:putative Holliday junction resolvase
LITTSIAEFAAVLPEGGRLAGLDPGTKTLGLATCDAGWAFASPHSTIARTKFTADLAQLRAFIAAERIKGLVIGLPLNMDGSDSPRTQSIRALARNLDTALARNLDTALARNLDTALARNLDTALIMPLLLWDERWSTQAVERAMIAEDLSRARRAARVDRLAAAYILQGAIDALTRPAAILPPLPLP